MDKDWTELSQQRLDEAEEAGDEARLAVLEEINDELEAELEMNRPRSGGAAEGVSEGGEARPPGR